MAIRSCLLLCVLQSAGLVAQNFTKPTGGKVLPYSGAPYFTVSPRAEALLTMHKNATALEIAVARNPILPHDHILLPGIQVNEIRLAGEI
jgi:hypothetical protein